MNEKTVPVRKASSNTLVLALAMLCTCILSMGVLAQHAWADQLPYPMKEIYSGTKSLVIKHPNRGNHHAFFANKMGKVSAVKISNPKILSVETSHYKKEAWLNITVKKVGSTKLTYKLGSKMHSVTINVVKYQNPFAALKLGSKSYKSKFNKDLWADMKLSVMAGKLTVKPAKNWKIKKITVSNNGKKHTIKNGAKLKKMTRAADYRRICIVMTNTKTGITDEYVLASL